MQWTKGIPGIEAVAEHERAFPGFTGKYARRALKRITISKQKPGADPLDYKYVSTYVAVEDEDSFGRWISHDPREDRIGGPHSQFLSLRVVDGEILMANGFTFWQPLADTTWARHCLFMPVTCLGLPIDYLPSHSGSSCCHPI